MQEACCRAEIERVAVFANSESVTEVTETGLSVGHFCCQSIGSETRHLRIVAQKGASFTSSSKNEFTPLHLVAFNGDVAWIKQKLSCSILIQMRLINPDLVMLHLYT